MWWPAEDTKKHKPDPEPVNIALKKLHSLPGNSIMLGDTMFDILCAKNAKSAIRTGRMVGVKVRRRLWEKRRRIM